MPRHAHQDAVDEQTFERLLNTADRLDEPFAAECRLILLLGGRLGLRAGEITHLRDEWIDWDREHIRIPAWDDCDHGIDGGVCGYCRKQARQRVRKSDDVTLETALQERWSPKTRHSVRTIPFGFDDRIGEVLEEFFFHRDDYPRSRSSINRRVDRVCVEAGYDPESLYPHALRATAATYHAYAGVPVAALQSLFGWAELQTAQKYVRLSGGATQQALETVYG